MRGKTQTIGPVQVTIGEIIRTAIIHGLDQRSYTTLCRLCAGRRKSNSLCIAKDPILSGQHCRIYFQDGKEPKFLLVDLESTNGTGIRLSPSKEASSRHLLKEGQTFGCGVTKFTVQYC